MEEQQATVFELSLEKQLHLRLHIDAINSCQSLEVLKKLFVQYLTLSVHKEAMLSAMLRQHM